MNFIQIFLMTTWIFFAKRKKPTKNPEKTHQSKG